jgi:hypothetical protein
MYCEGALVFFCTDHDLGASGLNEPKWSVYVKWNVARSEGMTMNDTKSSEMAVQTSLIDAMIRFVYGETLEERK